VVYGLSDCWVLNLLFERLECVECWMRVVSANWIRRIRSELLDGWMDGSRGDGSMAFRFMFVSTLFFVFSCYERCLCLIFCGHCWPCLPFCSTGSCCAHIILRRSNDCALALLLLPEIAADMLELSKATTLCNC